MAWLLQQVGRSMLKPSPQAVAFFRNHSTTEAVNGASAGAKSAKSSSDAFVDRAFEMLTGNMEKKVDAELFRSEIRRLAGNLTGLTAQLEVNGAELKELSNLLHAVNTKLIVLTDKFGVLRGSLQQERGEQFQGMLRLENALKTAFDEKLDGRDWKLLLSVLAAMVSGTVVTSTVISQLGYEVKFDRKDDAE